MCWLRCDGGFTVLELLVTTVILALLAIAVLGISGQVSNQSISVSEDMVRQGALQYSMDRLLEDIRTAGQRNAKMTVKRESVGMLETCRLTMAATDEKKAKGKPYWQVDWVAAPRYEEEDLLLFRREKISGDKEKALYVPLCEHLYLFDVALLKGNGEELEKAGVAPKLVEVVAQVFRAGEPDADRTMTVRRSCALVRF